MTEPLRLPAQAYVYVIGPADGPQKIGKADDVAHRRRMLQSASAHDLSVSFALPVNRDMALDVERRAHWLLREDRLRGEWFNITPAEARGAVEQAMADVLAGEGRRKEPSRAGYGVHPWQLRARASGLTQRMLARLLGHTELTVSRQLRGHWESGVPQHVRAAIIAWELMTPEMREQWLAEVENTQD